ncbi:5'-nucleotidase C-terminal domain-containing protein [Lentibacillus saliphilus]|uniref:5'-nucleotidase C-terminal domain-containing protein n=1 Tax=Lentibacillus saliphilus TaxID=2737028 RepID=UPI001C30E685|nr:5'-nucleotidase C-terminal domain-containing protein [Lentibacillus saliphilus]
MHAKMRQKYYSIALIFVLLLSLFTPAASPFTVEAKGQDVNNQFDLSIMHMNDTHARVESYPKMISAIKDVRAEKPEALLLNGGDVFSGTLYFNEFKGQADLELMNLMDIDAMVFGNHEFDLGSREDGHESLSNFVAGANFPFLGTNIDFSQDPFMRDLETGDGLIEAPAGGQIYNSIIKTINGEKVGIFGLTTEDTVAISSPMNVTFADFKVTAEQTVEALENAGVNKIIAVNHLGFDSAPEVGNDLRLAEEVPGIDVIVGGHSHSEVNAPVVVDKDANGNDKAPTVIVQAGDYAEFLGTVDVSFDESGEIISYSGQLLEVSTYDADADALKVMETYKTQIDKVKNEEIGAEALIELKNPRHKDSDESVRANETPLGNLITDAMLAKAQEKYPETVIAFQNGGGIRAPIDKGPITTGEVMKVLPFGNDPVVATLTGQEIKDILEHSVRQAPAENGGFLHVSGMKFSYDSTLEAGNRVKEMYVEKDGKLVPIEMTSNYLITTNGFTGQGGDGFETFAKAYEEGRVKDIGEIDWQQLRDYMVEDEYLGGKVNPEIENRIVDLRFDLSLMHMNDTHARVESYPKMISAIKDVRTEKPNALLLHGGDVFSGTLYFNEFKGQADLALMNMMGIDAMVFGNHEFDLGSKENGHESLSEFVVGANFPFLGTNIDFSKDPFMKDLETNESLVDAPKEGQIYRSLVKTINGEKVGIFGLTTEDTVNIASPMNVEFADFKAAAQKAVQEFEEAGINKIVAVNHLGFDSAPDVGNDLRLAEEVLGIDVIVGGHSHSKVEAPAVVDKDAEGNAKAPTVIVQAGQYGNFLGTVDVTFNGAGEVIEHAGQLLEVAAYEADAEALEVMSTYKSEIESLKNEEIGAEAMKDLINPRQENPGEDSVRANETALGNLITDAMLAKAQEKYPETIIAFQNGGGIRAPIDKGPITTGEVIEVLPFGNDPVVATLTGQEIKDILEHSVRQVPAESGGFLHVSGMQFYFDSTKDAGNRIVEMYVQKDGQRTPIDLAAEYLVTTNGFTGQGGDGFETFAKAYEEGRVKDIGEIDWQQLRDYMVEDLGGEVDPEREGRIVDLKGEDLPEEPGDNDPGTGEEDDGKTPDPGKDDDATPGDEAEEGETLPETATNMFTYLVIGIALLIVGAGTMLYRRRKLAQQ